MLVEYDFKGSGEEVKNVIICVLYYVYEGRNAWHSTWVNKYSNGCMHESLNSAKNHCEKLRKQGSVFYISQLPCIVFRSLQKALIVTEINSENPLSYYKQNLYSDLQKNIRAVANSFRPDSSYWTTPKPSKDSVVILKSNNCGILSERCNSKKFFTTYTSYLEGVDNFLAYTSHINPIKSDAILNLYEQMKNV